MQLGVHFTSSGGGAPNNTSGWWMTDQRFTLPGDLAPGVTSLPISISVTAPSGGGNLVLEYQMIKPSHFLFTQFAAHSLSVSPANWAASYNVASTPTNWAVNQ